MNLKFCFKLIIGITATFSVCAAKTSYFSPISSLEKLNNSYYFKDNNGRVIFYPCSMGGEPLVIYSALNGKPISSKTIWLPVYLKNGYEATPIMIPDSVMSETLSLTNLVIQTINPADEYLSINLERKDGTEFYVDTANFPIVDTVSGQEGTKQKYVSIFNVSINNTDLIYTYVDFPLYNYNFEQSVGLYVYSPVNQITARIASWNQNSKWTNGILGRNLSNIPYRFSPIKIEGAETYYDGFGFWICGSDQLQFNNKKGKQKIYMDKIG